MLILQYKQYRISSSPLIGLGTGCLLYTMRKRILVTLSPNFLRGSAIRFYGMSDPRRSSTFPPILNAGYWCCKDTRTLSPQFAVELPIFSPKLFIVLRIRESSIRKGKQKGQARRRPGDLPAEAPCDVYTGKYGRIRVGQPSGDLRDGVFSSSCFWNQRLHGRGPGKPLQRSCFPG